MTDCSDKIEYPILEQDRIEIRWDRPDGDLILSGYFPSNLLCLHRVKDEDNKVVQEVELPYYALPVFGGKLLNAWLFLRR